MQGVFRTVRASAVERLPVDAPDLLLASILVIARREDVGERGVPIRQEVEVRLLVAQKIEFLAESHELESIAILGEGDAERIAGSPHLLLGAKPILLGIEVVGPGLCFRGHASGIGVYQPCAEYSTCYMRTVVVGQFILLGVYPVAEIHVLGYVGIPDPYADPFAL